MGTGQKSNTLINPLAAQAMEKFKYEVANELGIQIPQ
ncbi:MAG: small, acid-soluble spore protein, alpha/beta type, partial [Halanaerobiales bacterium]